MRTTYHLIFSLAFLGLSANCNSVIDGREDLGATHNNPRSLGRNSGDDHLGDDNSGDDSLGGDNSGGDNSRDDILGGDNSGGDSSGGDDSGGDDSGGDNSGGDNSGGDNSGGDNSGVAPLFQDTIQTGTSPWGLTQLRTDAPYGTKTKPQPSTDDSLGASITRVPDPAGGDGYALRLYIDCATHKSGRAQVGWYSFSPRDQLYQLLASEMYVSAEFYIPEEMTGHNWIVFADWHQVDDNGGSRTHNSPNLGLGANGAFHSSWRNWNPGSGVIGTLPVGEWFHIEGYRKWSTTDTGAMRWWLNGSLIYEITDVQTANENQTHGEMYFKLAGAGRATSPSPQAWYIRNLRYNDTYMGPR